MSNRKLWWALGAVIVVGLIGSYLIQTKGPSSSDSARISGKVTAVEDGRPVDGTFYVRLDGNRLLLLDKGGLSPNGEVETKGKLTGQPKVGSRVDAYVQQFSPGSYSLYGKSEYYANIK